MQRAIRLGATHVDIGQGDVPWVVLADPEGNEFCVLEPREVYRDTGPVAAIVVDCVDPPGDGRVLDGRGELADSALRTMISSRCGHRLATAPYLELLAVGEPKKVKNRVHLDVAPVPDDDQRGRGGQADRTRREAGRRRSRRRVLDRDGRP